MQGSIENVIILPSVGCLLRRQRSSSLVAAGRSARLRRRHYGATCIKINKNKKPVAPARRKKMERRHRIRKNEQITITSLLNDSLLRTVVTTVYNKLINRDGHSDQPEFSQFLRGICPVPVIFAGNGGYKVTGVVLVHPSPSKKAHITCGNQEFYF